VLISYKMQNNILHNRLIYSPFLTYLLGGILGTSLNLIITIYSYSFFKINPYVSFFLGMIFNLLFNHAYYYLVFVNKEIRLKTPIYIQLFLYLVIAIAGAFVLWLFMNLFKLEFIHAIILLIIILSLLSSIFIKISAFSSSVFAHTEYAEIKDSYYDDLTDKKKSSRFRSWYHSSRFGRLGELVYKNYQPSMKIADLGCGNCLWNKNFLPVTGVDINGEMLKWAQQNKYLSKYIVTKDLAKTTLPSKAFDIVIMSETLEHILNLEEVLAEVRRIIKDDGTFIITVPYDFFFGPFFILFNLNCVYMGFLRGSKYHRLRCGHINHFTKKRLRNLLKENGFGLIGLSVVNYLLLYATAKKA